MKWVRRGWYSWLDYVVAAWWEVRSFFVRRPPARWTNGSKPPVVLLSGVYEPWHFLRSIGDRLNAAGHPVHVVPEIRYNKLSIPSVAGLAQNYVDSRDLRGVILVAHSKGGLVGKHMMAIDDTGGRIDRLVAVVTPFAGSTMARYMPISTLRAFMPTDATVATLAANLALNGRITSVYGEFDPQIPGGSGLDGGVNVELPIVGHFRLLADERVIRAVESAVAGTTDTGPGVE